VQCRDETKERLNSDIAFANGHNHVQQANDNYKQQQRQERLSRYVRVEVIVLREL
jgi:hypothetical protein